MLCQTLTELHPRIVLEAVLDNDTISDDAQVHFFGRVDDDEQPRRSLPNIDPKVILDWVQESPERRAGLAAKILPYETVDEHRAITWTKPALNLIELPRVGLLVLDAFRARFAIGAGSGSWHDRLLRRRRLIETLTGHNDVSIRDWAATALQDFDQFAARLMGHDRNRDERFE